MANIRKHVGKNGEVSYKVQIRMAGTKPRYASFRRLSDAKEWAREEETKLQRRRGGLQPQDRHTLAEAIDKFIAEEMARRPERDQYWFKCGLAWWRRELGPMQLRSITPADLERGRDMLAREPKIKPNGKPYDDLRPRAPATVKRYMAMLSIVFTTAVKKWDGWLEDNPMARAEKPKLENERCRCLSGYLYHFPGDNEPRHWDDLTTEEKRRVPHDAYELPRLLEACRKQVVEASRKDAAQAYRAFGYHPEWLYSLIVLRVSTGLRSGEAEGLRWSNVDLFLSSNQGRATIGKTKNGDPITVPLVGEALRVLREMHQTRRLDCNWIFPRKDRQKPIDFRKRFARAIADAGIEDFRPHDLRHTAGSYFAMAGGSLPEIMAALNHKTPQVTKRYMHFAQAHTAGLVSLMNEAVFGGRGSVSRFEQTAANDNDSDDEEPARSSA